MLTADKHQSPAHTTQEESIDDESLAHYMRHEGFIVSQKTGKRKDRKLDRYDNRQKERPYGSCHPGGRNVTARGQTPKGT